MNIVLLVIDTLRYDYIGAHGNDWIQTPNMDRLAAEGWVFDNSFAASYPTIPHRTDAITGTHGSPFHAWRPLPFDVHTLPRVLAEGGYCSQLIHDTPHLVNGGHNFDWPFSAWTCIRGAEVDRPWIDNIKTLPENWTRDELFDFADWDAAVKEFRWSTYARANRRRKTLDDWNCMKLFRTASQFLRDNAGRENFFLWADCFDPHEPWDAPPEFMKMYVKTPGYDGMIDPRSFTFRNQTDVPEEAQNRVKAAYAAKVSWVDHCLGVFLDTLDQTGLSKNTAVVLTADHGTNVGERGKFGKGWGIYESVCHTPFIVRIPGGGSGRSDIIVQPQDIFATVMAIAGLETPGELDSHDVVAAARDDRRPRDIAISGTAAAAWNRPQRTALFGAFDGQWCMEVAARAEDCRLVPAGSVEDVAAQHPDVVDRLHAAAVEELERRGTDKAIMKWLRAGGKGKFPEKAKFFEYYPAPAGYTQYWTRIYTGQ
ncbi:MAG: sulfatase [Planctomycetota bacterium]|jgi:arylsulfatase A-like enzyme